jgi:hypothetical protein
MEILRIELRSSGCKPNILPLNYIPLIFWQGRARTYDISVNSRMLFQLSYMPIILIPTVLIKSVYTPAIQHHL